MPGFYVGARDNSGPHAAASTLSAEPSLQPFFSPMQIWLHNTIISRVIPHGHLVSAQAKPHHQQHLQQGGYSCDSCSTHTSTSASVLSTAGRWATCHYTWVWKMYMTCNHCNTVILSMSDVLKTPGYFSTSLFLLPLRPGNHWHFYCSHSFLPPLGHRLNHAGCCISRLPP